MIFNHDDSHKASTSSVSPRSRDPFHIVTYYINRVLLDIQYGACSLSEQKDSALYYLLGESEVFVILTHSV